MRASTTVAYRPYTALTRNILSLSLRHSTKCAILIHCATVVLGCVTESTEPQVDHGSGQVGKSHPTAAGFIAAKRDPGGVLEAGERVLDVVGVGGGRRGPRRGVEEPLPWGGGGRG